MQPDVLKRKQAALREYLYDMALSCMDESQLRQMLTKLKSIYSNDFRHSYSEFFPMIVEISKDNNSCDLDFLSNNLEALREMVLKSFIEGESESNALYQSLDKLIDHINLEIARYSHYSMSEQKVNDLESKHRTLQSELKESTEALKSAQKKGFHRSNRIDSRVEHLCRDSVYLFGKHQHHRQRFERHGGRPVFQSGVFCAAMRLRRLQHHLFDDVYSRQGNGKKHICALPEYRLHMRRRPA